MDYNFETLKEAGWFVGTAVGVALFEALIHFDPLTLTNWETWAVGLGGALVRAGAGAALAFMAKRKIG